MKKTLLLLTVLLFSAVTFAQKKELRNASKAIDKNKYQEAQNLLSQIESEIINASPEQQAEFYLYRGKALLGAAQSDEQLFESGQAFQKVIEMNNDKYNAEARDGIQNLRAKLVNAAVENQNQENYEAAAKKLYISYQISPKDTSDLYYAAGNALNAQNYDTAIEYYKKLIDLGYSGKEKQYTAIDKETNETVDFASEKERDLAVLTGQYTNPASTVSDSRRGEILKNTSLLMIQQGKIEEAKKLIQEAQKENPQDISLIEAEARIALQLGDMETYTSLMQKIVEADPDNPEMYYNLGVASAELGKIEEAKKYYTKAISIDPDYYQAQINMAALILEKEGEIIEEMNALGTSVKDNKRYEELKKERENLYQEAIPYLENALSNQPDNVQVMRTLMNIYSITGEDAKFQAMKHKLETTEN